MPRASQPDPYIEELQQQALEINHELHAFCNDYLVKLAYIDMQPLNTDDYYEGKKDRKPFRPKETPLKRIEKEEGVSLWLKLKAAYPGYPGTCGYFHDSEHLCGRDEGSEKGRV